MKQELDEYLCKVFPKIFVNRGNELESIQYGFECGDGWFDIINQLCQNIQHHINWKNEQFDKYGKGSEVQQVVVEQVKEKFGTLRFYYQGGDDYIGGLVAMAESISGVTCEECGDKGESSSEGWIKVLCEDHRNERNRKYQV